MTRAELERLWKLKAEIIAHERALSDIEAKEAARTRRGTSFLHSLSPPRSEADLSGENLAAWKRSLTSGEIFWKCAQK